MKGVIEESVGKPIYEIFKEFQHKPIGAASIGQVSVGLGTRQLRGRSWSPSRTREHATAIRQAWGKGRVRVRDWVTVQWPLVSSLGTSGRLGAAV